MLYASNSVHLNLCVPLYIYEYYIILKTLFNASNSMHLILYIIFMKFILCLSFYAFTCIALYASLCMHLILCISIYITHYLHFNKYQSINHVIL